MYTSRGLDEPPTNGNVIHFRTQIEEPEVIAGDDDSTSSMRGGWHGRGDGDDDTSGSSRRRSRVLDGCNARRGDSRLLAVGECRRKRRGNAVG